MTSHRSEVVQKIESAAAPRTLKAGAALAQLANAARDR
jgi:hypothetical protein